MFMERKNDDEFAREWEKAKLVAGLTDVVGNGVIVYWRMLRSSMEENLSIMLCMTWK